jgi:hypothetical protein
MASDRISRNDPCPCGSGKKFKNCCINKGSRSRPAKILPRAPRPTAAPPPDIPFSGLFTVSDARLKEIAKATPGLAIWKTRVERLSESTPDPERLEAYRLVRMVGVLPDEATGFLFVHAAQWLSDADEVEELNRDTLALLRRCGQDDLADLFERDRLDFDRRYERGRQFFHGPPEEEMAAHLRKRGIID